MGGHDEYQFSQWHLERVLTRYLNESKSGLIETFHLGKHELDTSIHPIKSL
jgi:hypothetical protein